VYAIKSAPVKKICRYRPIFENGYLAFTSKQITPPAVILDYPVENFPPGYSPLCRR
jgi:hypothetical protein